MNTYLLLTNLGHARAGEGCCAQVDQVEVTVEPVVLSAYAATRRHQT
jgi:hypothetical protein